jgi:hypothetical protein
MACQNIPFEKRNDQWPPFQKECEPCCLHVLGLLWGDLYILPSSRQFSLPSYTLYEPFLLPFFLTDTLLPTTPSFPNSHNLPSHYRDARLLER